MHNISHYFDKAIGNNDKMRELEDIVCEVMQNFSTAHPNLYEEAMFNMHKVIYGEHFDSESAECIVSQLENADGTTGPHWARVNTDIMAKRLGIKDTDDFYVLVNHLYSEYGNVLGTDGNIFAKMAQNIINNHDSRIFKMYMTK